MGSKLHGVVLRKPFFLIGPLPILIISVLSIAASIWVSIYSSLEFDERLGAALNQVKEQVKLNNNIFEESFSWTPLVILIVFFVITLSGLVIIFTYYQKIRNLYRLQENFISNFTHELKTPVTSIKLYLETMKKRDLEKDQISEILEFMLRDTDRLHQNIEQILQTSKVEAQNQNFELEDFEINSFLASTIEKVSHLFDGEIIFSNKSRQKIYCRIDTTLFENVIINLLTNGFKYNDSKEKKVEIFVETHYGKIEIYFRDNGRGIAKEYQRKIFKKFYRATKDTKGTGLGLYLVSQIISYHKGKVILRSKGEGKGSDFIVELPRFYPAKLPQFSSSNRSTGHE